VKLVDLATVLTNIVTGGCAANSSGFCPSPARLGGGRMLRSASILDLCGGHGRHSLELSRRYRLALFS